MNKSKSTVIDRDRKAIAGVQKHYGSAPTIVLDGIAVAPTAVVKVFQDQINAADATAAAKTAYELAVAAEKAAMDKANGMFLALKARAFSDFKTSPDTLVDFGLALPKRTPPSPATKAAAADKLRATRKARHTMGTKQKAAIKGQVPAAPPKPSA